MLNIIRRELGEDTFNLNPCWIIEKAKEFQKNIYFCFIDYTPALGGGGIDWKGLKTTFWSDGNMKITKHLLKRIELSLEGLCMIYKFYIN